jgi:hypothetical protein
MTLPPESEQKKRKSLQRPPREVLENRIAECAQTVATKHRVLSVEPHFAGYFNELGLRVDVAADAAPNEVLDLANALLEAITQTTSTMELSFSWTVGIYRGEELLRVLSPGDHPRRICPACTTEQPAADAVCSVCGASF